MLEFSDDTKELYRRIQLAKDELKKTNNPYEKIALYSYIDSTYDSISSIDNKELCIKNRNIFGSNKKYRKFLSNVYLLENEMNENFILNKKFVSKYIGKILLGIEELQPFNYKNQVDTFHELNMDEFNDIFYQFMQSIHLEEYFDKYLKNNKIYNYKINDIHTLGYTLYNIVDGNSNIYLDEFIPDIKSLFILAHEFGHVFDLNSFNNDASSYIRYNYQSFYSETISKLFEKLLSNFLINNNILKEEAKTNLLDIELDNYNYLLKTLILSLLDDSYVNGSNNVYLNLDKLSNKFFDVDLINLLRSFDYLNLYDDCSYAFSDILSMFLFDSIINDGFYNELIDNFVKNRDKMLSKEFFLENGLSADNYIDLYKKELKLLKK